MTPEKSKKWQRKEEERLIKYQHQHRGLSFIKLLLPPPKDRKVNLVGVDNHIYRGSVAKLPEDKLPPDVDEKSIDEEALYEEIRNINFPPVPPLEPLGPSRRIGGEYTLKRRLHLAPIKVNLEELQEITILGKDGGIYKGMVKFPSKLELDRQLRGSKKPIQKVRKPSSSRGFVEPSLVVLQTGGKSPLPARLQKSLVEIPASNVGKIVEIIVSQSKRKKDKDHVKDDLTQEKDETKAEETEEAKEIDESSEDERDAQTELISTKSDDPEIITGDTDESEEESKEDSEVDEHGNISEIEEDVDTKDADESGNITEIEEDEEAKDAYESGSSRETEEFEISKDVEMQENPTDMNVVESAKETEDSWTTEETVESQSVDDSEET